MTGPIVGIIVLGALIAWAAILGMFQANREATIGDENQAREWLIARQGDHVRDLARHLQDSGWNVTSIDVLDCLAMAGLALHKDHDLIVTDAYWERIKGHRP